MLKQLYYDKVWSIKLRIIVKIRSSYVAGHIGLGATSSIPLTLGGGKNFIQETGT